MSSSVNQALEAAYINISTTSTLRLKMRGSSIYYFFDLGKMLQMNEKSGTKRSILRGDPKIVPTNDENNKHAKVKGQKTRKSSYEPSPFLYIKSPRNRTGSFHRWLRWWDWYWRVCHELRWWNIRWCRHRWLVRRQHGSLGYRWCLPGWFDI